MSSATDFLIKNMPALFLVSIGALLFVADRSSQFIAGQLVGGGLAILNSSYGVTSAPLSQPKG